MVYPSKDEESFFLRDPFLSVPYVGRRLGFTNRAMTRESRKNKKYFKKIKAYLMQLVYLNLYIFVLIMIRSCVMSKMKGYNPPKFRSSLSSSSVNQHSSAAGLDPITRYSTFISDDHHLENVTSILVVRKSNYKTYTEGLDESARNWLSYGSNLNMNSFPGNRMVKIPNDSEGFMPVKFVAFVDDEKRPRSYKTFQGLWDTLKCSGADAHSAGVFRLAIGEKGNKNENDNVNKNSDKDELLELEKDLATSFLMHKYKFNRYKGRATKNVPSNGPSKEPVLIWPRTLQSAPSVQAEILSLCSAYTLAKDLINTPAEDMGPAQFQAAVETTFDQLKGVKVKAIVGEEALASDNLHQIIAVGRAAGKGREPRLLDIRWESSSSSSSSSTKNISPKTITIVGKGVCFDTGGLNIKGDAGMRFMKKDMGGAAQATALFYMLASSSAVKKAGLKIRLLLPLVENSISGNAIRPGDVITAKNGKTTEITNTDAEGRLILADALVTAAEENPSLIVDFATLTGAARVALGTEVAALFSNKPEVGAAIVKKSMEVMDPVWQLPLWKNYKSGLKSSVADMVNSGGAGGGAITAALYLSEFISPPTTATAQGSDSEDEDEGEDEKEQEDADEKSGGINNGMTWVHLDFMGMKGELAEPQGLRTMYSYILSEYCK